MQQYNISYPQLCSKSLSMHVSCLSIGFICFEYKSLLNVFGVYRNNKHNIIISKYITALILRSGLLSWLKVW